MEPGKFYHIYNRGNNKENLFKTDDNYFYFLKLYKRYIYPVAATYAYCLLPNHFHLLIRVRDGQEQAMMFTNIGAGGSGDGIPFGEPGAGVSNYLNAKEARDAIASLQKFKPPSEQFRRMFISYTQAINTAFGRRGSLFEKNFKYKEVTTESYFNRLIWYIHLNPQRHGLMADFRDWPHSSYHSLPATKPTLLERQQVLGWFGGTRHYEEFHAEPHRLTEIGELLIDE